MAEHQLSERERDELKELGNIGAGRASRYLSDLVDKKVDIGIPDVRIVDLQEGGEKMAKQVFKKKSDQKLTAVLMPLKDGGGAIVFAFEQMDYQRFLNMWKEGSGGEGNGNFLQVSKKVGSFYLEAIENLLGIELESEEPKLMTLDTNALAIHTTSGMNSECGPEKDCVLAINTEMKIADSESRITMLLEHNHVQKMLNSMEEKL